LVLINSDQMSVFIAYHRRMVNASNAVKFRL